MIFRSWWHYRPYLSSLAQGLWGRHDASRAWLVTVGVHAYYDASRKQESPAGVLMVAALVAKESKWATFERRWQKDVLTKFDVPYVDMAVFEAGHGPYKKWRGKESEREQFRAAIMATINRSTNRIFTAGVDLADYHTVDAEFEMSEIYGNGEPGAGAYTACALHCILWADGWIAKRFPGARIVHLVEKGDAGQGALVSGAKAVPELRGQIIPLAKKDPNTQERVRPFEAVDALAWEARNLWETYLKKGEVPNRPSTWKLMNSIPGEIGALMARDLRKLCEDNGVPRRK